MPLQHERLTQDLEEEGRVTTEVIGLRYVGPESSMTPTEPRIRGGWPGTSAFQGGEIVERREEDKKVTEREPGPIQIGINPDWLDDTVEGGNLDGLEQLQHFEVIYDPEVLAEALLERNFLPPDLFGHRDQSFEPDVRNAVFEKLGIDDVGLLPNAEEAYREQLSEIAGVEFDPTNEDVSLLAELRQQVSRQEAIAAADALDEDVDEQTTSKTEALELVADYEEGRAKAVLRDVGAEV